MKIGYARVSTMDQSLSRQLDQLREEGCERIFEEKQSGKNTDRPELVRMLDCLRPGDIVIVAELTRLSRTVRDLYTLVDKIQTNGAEIKSLKEQWLNTSTPQGRLLFVFFSGLAQFERELIQQRTLEGLNAARARGRRGGHPVLDSKKVELAMKMYATKTCSVPEILTATGISKSALYSYIRKSGQKS